MQFIFRLRWRLLALTLLIALPAFVLIYIANIEQRNNDAQAAQQDALKLVRNIAMGQSQFIAETRMLLTMLVSMPQLSPEQPTNCNRFLAGLKQDLPYTFVGVATASGEVVCGTTMPRSVISIADRDYFQLAKSSRSFATSDYQVGKVTGKPVLVFATPIIHTGRDVQDGDFQGVVMASIELSWLQGEIAAAALPVGSAVTVFDRHGTVMARHPETKGWIGRTLPAQMPLIQTVMDTTEEGTVEGPGLDGQPQLTAYMRLPALAETVPVYITVEIPRAVAFAHANQVWQRNLGWLTLGNIAMAVLAWLGSEFLIRRRVEALLQATRRLATGDLSVRIGLCFKRRDR